VQLIGSSQAALSFLCGEPVMASNTAAQITTAVRSLLFNRRPIRLVRPAATAGVMLTAIAAGTVTLPAQQGSEP
jgi:hypothetical protein